MNKPIKVKREGLFKKISIEALLIALFMIITMIVLVPIAITVFAAFKTPIEFGRDFPLKPPSRLMWDNFVLVFTKGKMLLALKNSLFLVVVTVVVNSLLASMVAYVLARFEFRFKKVLVFVFLLGMIIPGFITEIARFGIIRDIGLCAFA